jgi:hypothetical protein
MHTEFEHYFSHIGPWDLICGNFNAHHPLWSCPCTKPNWAGISLFNAISKTPLLLLNTPGIPTRLDTHSGTGSVLDLFVGASSYFPYSVSLGWDLGSDHTPLLLKSTPRKIPRISSVP